MMVPDVDGTLVPGSQLVITYYPFNMDSLLAAVAEKSGAGPRPNMRALDSLFSAFQPAYQRYVTLDDQRRKLSKSSDVGADSLARLDSAIAKAQVDLKAAEARYWPAIETLR